MALGNLLQPDIHEVIENKDFSSLKKFLREMEIHNLFELLDELEDDDLAVCFRLLPQDRAAEIIGDFEPEQQEELLTKLSTEKVAAILNEMPPDDRTELLEEMPGDMARRLLNTLTGEERGIARSLLAYPEDSIGRLMTPEYVAVRADWTIEQVLGHIRKVAGEKETWNILYIVDEKWKLLDEISLEDVILAEPDQTVGDLMDEQTASLQASEDQEEAIEVFKKHDAVALPVVNRQGILVGIVTHDDVIDVVEEEDTEDMQKFAGFAALEASYFTTGFWGMVRKRLPWLVMLFVAEILTVAALTAFGSNLEPTRLAIMVGFVPLINSCAGNTGSQMAGLMIRGLAVAELDFADWSRVLARELFRGVSLGLVLGAMGFATVLIFHKPVALAVGVMLALVAVMALANILGSMLPLLFKRIGVDPAVTSGPFIASVMDISAILIYFSIAVAILHAAG